MIKERLRVTADGWGFERAQSRERFVPVGANYFDPNVGWPPRIWHRYDDAAVRRHLDDLAGQGFNIIRIFLDCRFLCPEDGRVDEKALDTTARMAEYAAERGIYVLYSGVYSDWSGPPAWARGDQFADPALLEKICALWRSVVRRLKDIPAVAIYDLLNEPHLHWQTEARLQPWREWSREHLGRRIEEIPANTPVTDRAAWIAYVRFLESLAAGWTRRQAQAIRETDPAALVSVGLLQFSVPVHVPGWSSYPGISPAVVAPYVDYSSIHYYPMLIRMEDGLEPHEDLYLANLETVVRGARMPGKPTVIEEFGWYGGGALRQGMPYRAERHQADYGRKFIERTRGCACGWLNWGYADQPDASDVSERSGLFTNTGTLKEWGKAMGEFARQAQVQPPCFRSPDRTIDVDFYEFLADHAGRPPVDFLREQVLPHNAGKNVEVRFVVRGEQ
jgi:hypothetical protein